MQFEAIYHDGLSSSSELVLVKVTEEGEVTIIPTSSSFALPLIEPCAWGALKVKPRIAETPRWIDLPNGAQLESLQNNDIDAIQFHFQGGLTDRLIHSLERSWWSVILGLAVTVLFLWGTVQYGVPAAANLASKAIPEEVLYPLGDDVVVWLDDNLFEPSLLPTERKAELTNTFNQYFNHSDDFKLLFRASPKIGANALALPNNTIILTDELVALATDDDQIIAVLAHEVGHLASRHAIRRLLQQTGIAAILMVFTGDISSVSSAIAYLPALLIELGYSRDFEYEADDYAIEFMTEHRIPKEAFSTILTRLHQHHSDAVVTDHAVTDDEVGDKDGHVDDVLLSDIADDGESSKSQVFDYLSTHPGVDQRIQRISSD